MKADRIASRAGKRARQAAYGVSILAVAATAGWTTPAFAQDSGAATPAAQSDTPTDEEPGIVVTGIRASVTNARNIKRNADQIVDSITAQDIGALPDRSVSEALQRIPGITLQRTNENRDPARLAAEGGGVFVRGLSWVRSETNGRDIFSANNGRALSFEDVSPDLLAGVDVYKNPSAEMVEGGIGGLVNLRTRKPFDAQGQVIALSGDYNYADLRKKGFWSANGLYSNRWSLGGTEIGILLSGSINNIGNRTDSIQLGTYTPRANNDPNQPPVPAAFQNILVPNSLGWRRIDWQQKRTAFDGALQFSPIPEMTFTAEAMVATADPHDIEHAEGVYSLPNYDSSYAVDGNKVLTQGTYRNANMDLDTRYGDSHKVTRDLSFNWKWTPSDRLALSADVQRITSKSDVLSMTAFTEFGVAPGFFDARRPDISFDLRGDSPSVTTKENGASLATAANYWWAAAMDHIERNNAGEWAERADLEYKFADDSFLKSFRAGARATSREAVTRQTGYNWGLLSNQFWGNGGGAAVYLPDQGSPANSGLPMQSEQFNYSNFFRGNIAVPGVGWFPSDALVSNGTANAYNYLKSTETSGWGWVPLTEASFASANPAADNPSGGIATQQEKTLAGYAMLRFGSDRFDGNIGVRVVRTRNEAIGYLSVGSIQNALTGPACLAAHPAAACQGLIQALAFSNGGAGGRLADQVYKNSYTDVLPTLNLRFRATDQLQFRVAMGRAMIRPNFTQLRPYASLNFTLDPNGYTLLAQPNGLTGQAGNPFLKPTKSDQFDFSAEYYFGRSNSLTFAAFYKDISNYIISGNANETYTSNGQTLTFNVTRAVNGAKGKIKGFEVAYTQFYDFLPGALGGLGFSANFTYVDSTGGANQPVNTLDPNQVSNAADTTLPLEGLSKTSYNVALIYEKYGVSARLAYNWRSHYLLTTSAANLNAPVWSEAYGQLDGSILVNITKNIKIGVQGTNLLNTRTFLDVGGAVLHPRYSWTDTDRRIAGIIRTSF